MALAKRAVIWLDLFVIAGHKLHKLSFQPALEAEQRPRMGRGGGHCLPCALFLTSLQLRLCGSIKFSQIFPLEGVPAAHIMVCPGAAARRSLAKVSTSWGRLRAACSGWFWMCSASSGDCQASPKGNLDIILMDFLWLISISYGVFFLQSL